MRQENSKTVKQEKIGDEDDEKTIASLGKRSNKSPNNGNGTPTSQPKTKKEEKKPKKEEEEEDFVKPTSTGAPKKIDNKGKMTKEEEEEEEEEEAGKMKKKGGQASESKDVKKREKKVFDLPGQKRVPPEEREPLRIFYQTLYNQVPDSEMASTWMMESGLLPKEEANKVFDRKMKKDQNQKLGSPMKTITVKRKADSVTIEKRSAKSPVSTCTRIKKTTAATPSKMASQPSRKRKRKDPSSEDDKPVMASFLMRAIRRRSRECPSYF
ncbi:hypothetical protein OROGR_016555 [Orobanche gracilis]